MAVGSGQRSRLFTCRSARGSRGTGHLVTVASRELPARMIGTSPLAERTSERLELALGGIGPPGRTYGGGLAGYWGRSGKLKPERHPGPKSSEEYPFTRALWQTLSERRVGVLGHGNQRAPLAAGSLV